MTTPAITSKQIVITYISIRSFSSLPPSLPPSLPKDYWYTHACNLEIIPECSLHGDEQPSLPHIVLQYVLYKLEPLNCS